MLTLLAISLMSAGPAAGLALSEQMGKPSTPATVYLDEIERELVGATLAVRRLSLTCAGKRECLLAATKTEGLPALVAVTLAYGKKQTTIDLEAMRTADGTTVSQLTFSVTGRLTDTERAAVQKFGAQLVRALSTPSDTPLVEPKKPDVVTRVTPTDPALVVTQPKLAPRSKVPAWVMGGGAVASGVTSAIFLGLASSKAAELERTPDPSPLTRVQADQLAANANTEFTVALATGIAAGALLTGAVIWLVTE